MTFLLSFPVFITIWVFGSLIVVILDGLLKLVFRIYNRSMRTINIVSRGWPPEHIDADGDFRPHPKPKKAEEQQ